MREVVRPRVFVSHSYGDEGAKVVIDGLSERFDVLSSSYMRGTVSVAAGLPNVVKTADVFLILWPGRYDRERTRLVYEAGVAAGAGVPVLCAGATPPPGPLQALPFMDDFDEDSLATVLEQVMTWGGSHAEESPGEPQRLLAAAPVKKSSRSRKEGVYRDEFRMIAESEMLEWTATLLRSAGGEVIVPERRLHHGMVDSADLVLWDDRLIAPFGMPLPVEIVRDIGKVGALRKRLLNTLKGTGATSILAIAMHGDGTRFWPTGEGFILAVTARNLSDALDDSPLDEALIRLLNEASA